MFILDKQRAAHQHIRGCKYDDFDTQRDSGDDRLLQLSSSLK